METINFVQKIVERESEEIDRLSWSQQFSVGFSDTVMKTLHIHQDKSVFLVTGDIPAMWLRDSTAQVYPYLMEMVIILIKLK